MGVIFRDERVEPEDVLNLVLNSNGPRSSESLSRQTGHDRVKIVRALRRLVERNQLDELVGDDGRVHYRASRFLNVVPRFKDDDERMIVFRWLDAQTTYASTRDVMHALKLSRYKATMILGRLEACGFVVDVGGYFATSRNAGSFPLPSRESRDAPAGGTRYRAIH